MFFEKFDASQRETKLVLLGVPDEQESLDGAINDDTKLRRVWEAIEETGVPIKSHQRLGRQVAGRRRPILVNVASKEHRDAVIEKAKKLKNDRREEFQHVFIKKDVHPAVRKEWGRLRGVLKKETEKAENVGVRIHLDTRERKIYRNDVVIDTWKANYF